MLVTYSNGNYTIAGAGGTSVNINGTPLFPTLSVNPDVSGWQEEVAFDPTIKTQMEGGIVTSRSRFTRIPLKWTVPYIAAPTEDKDLVQTFERSTVKIGALSFIWTNPTNNLLYLVRLSSPIQYKMNTTSIKWDFTVSIEEV